MSEQEGEQEREWERAATEWETRERERMLREALESGAETRRAILRRAALMSWGFLGLAVLVALGGSAFIAWIFMAVELPFLKTWLVLSLVTLGVPALGQLVMRLRERRVRKRGDDT